MEAFIYEKRFCVGIYDYHGYYNIQHSTRVQESTRQIVEFMIMLIMDLKKKIFEL